MKQFETIKKDFDKQNHFIKKIRIELGKTSEMKETECNIPIDSATIYYFLPTLANLINLPWEN